MDAAETCEDGLCPPARQPSLLPARTRGELLRLHDAPFYEVIEVELEE